MFFTSRCFSFPLGVSADDRLTSNHIQSRKQTTRGATAGGERKERTAAEGRGKRPARGRRDGETANTKRKTGRRRRTERKEKKKERKRPRLIDVYGVT